VNIGPIDCSLLRVRQCLRSVRGRTGAFFCFSVCQFLLGSGGGVEEREVEWTEVPVKWKSVEVKVIRAFWR
jgi:hypothetical protein